MLYWCHETVTRAILLHVRREFDSGYVFLIFGCFGDEEGQEASTRCWSRRAMAGASPATTIHDQASSLRSIVVAGLAPAMALLDAFSLHALQ